MFPISSLVSGVAILRQGTWKEVRLAGEIRTTRRNSWICIVSSSSCRVDPRPLWNSTSGCTSFPQSITNRSHRHCLQIAVLVKGCHGIPNCVERLCSAINVCASNGRDFLILIYRHRLGYLSLVDSNTNRFPERATWRRSPIYLICFIYRRYESSMGKCPWGTLWSWVFFGVRLSSAIVKQIGGS